MSSAQLDPRAPSGPALPSRSADPARLFRQVGASISRVEGRLSTSDKTTPPEDGFRRFKRIVDSSAVSLLGMAVLQFALSVHVFEESGSATAFAAYATAWQVGLVVGMGTLGGTIDRRSHKSLLIVFDAIAAAMSGLILVVLHVVPSPANLWLIVAIVFVHGVASGGTSIAWPAVIPSLVLPDQLLAANARRALVLFIAHLAAPSLGALALAHVGLDGIVFFDVASYALTILVIWRTPFPKGTSTAPPQPVWSSFAVGWRWIREREPLRRLLGYAIIMGVASEVGNVLVGPLVLTTDDPTALGIITSVGIVGGMAVSLFLMRRSVRPTSFILLALGMVQGLAGVVFALFRTPVGYGIASLAVGAASTAGDTIGTTIWQSRVPAEVRGRVFAAQRTALIALTPIVTLSSAFVADHAAGWVLGRLDGIATAIGSGMEGGFALCILAASCGIIVLVATMLSTKFLRALDDTREPEPGSA